MLFERTAISKKPDDLIRQELKKLSENNTLTPDLVFRDPYFLDFLGLKNTYSEKNLEDWKEHLEKYNREDSSPHDSRIQANQGVCCRNKD